MDTLSSSDLSPQAVRRKELEPADIVNPDFSGLEKAHGFDRSDQTGAVSNSGV